MLKRVSVVIPVYNAEQYLVQCIESLLGQTLQECEFIFINDGSTDRSREIIEEFARKDTRIILLNQDNKGVSVARNNGLEVAEGEYIGFVDADDYVNPEMFQVLYKSAKNGDCDVIISNFEIELEGHHIITAYPFPVDTILDKNYIDCEILPYFIKSDNLNTVCNKLFRNKVIRENHVVFPKEYALGEDGRFNMKFFAYCNNATYINYVGYHYREVQGSATRSITEKDYFKRSLEVYRYPEIYTGKLDAVTVQKLKAIKLVNSVMSYIYVYFAPTSKNNFLKRYKYVRNMICNDCVTQALNLCYDELRSSMGRYDGFLIQLIKKRFTIGLYFATAYSRFRNGVGGNIM